MKDVLLFFYDSLCIEVQRTTLKTFNCLSSGHRHDTEFNEQTAGRSGRFYTFNTKIDFISHNFDFCILKS